MPVLRTIGILALLMSVASTHGEPAYLAHFGISIETPRGSIISTKQIDGNPQTAIRLPDNLGTLAINRRTFAGERVSPAAIEKVVIADLLGLDAKLPLVPAAFDGTDRGRMLRDVSEVRIAGASTRVLTVMLAENETVRAFAVLPEPGAEALIFELLTTSDNRLRASVLFESTLASVSRRALDRADPDVAKALRAGSDFLINSDPIELGLVVAGIGERLDRIYTDDPSGDKGRDVEIGFRRVRAWSGQRGELENRPRSEWQREDESFGTMLVIEARFFLADGVSDSRAQFFISDDRRREFWTSSTALRLKSADGDRARPIVWREYGTRNFSNMTIVIEPADARAVAAAEELAASSPMGMLAPAASQRVVRPFVRLEGYASRLEMEIMPFLLAASSVTADDFAFAAFDASLEEVALHGVRISAPEPAQEDARGTQAATATPALVVTILKPGGEAERVELDAEQRLIRRTLPGQRVIEPIAPAELRRIYQRKGLPIS